MVHPSSQGFKWNALTLCRDPDFEPLVFMRNLLVGHLTSDQLQLATDFVNRKKLFSNEKTRAKSFFLSVVACHKKLPLSVKINRFITNNHFFSKSRSSNCHQSANIRIQHSKAKFDIRTDWYVPSPLSIKTDGSWIWRFLTHTLNTLNEKIWCLGVFAFTWRYSLQRFFKIRKKNKFLKSFNSIFLTTLCSKVNKKLLRNLSRDSDLNLEVKIIFQGWTTIRNHITKTFEIPKSDLMFSTLK